MIAYGASGTLVRKLMQCTGQLASAALLPAPPMAHSPGAALALTWCGFAPGNLDIAPRHGGGIVGFTNSIGQIAGISGVAVTGWIVDVTGTHPAAFALAAALSVACAAVFALLYTARPFTE
jgi:MFS transporter, ACS family, solute carrier family 17 (sodium-dependent inorganic phosphate cotransporter), other